MSAVAARVVRKPPYQALTITAAKNRAHGVGFRRGHVAYVAANAMSTASMRDPYRWSRSISGVVVLMSMSDPPGGRCSPSLSEGSRNSGKKHAIWHADQDRHSLNA